MLQHLVHDQVGLLVFAERNQVVDHCVSHDLGRMFELPALHNGAKHLVAEETFGERADVAGEPTNEHFSTCRVRRVVRLVRLAASVSGGVRGQEVPRTALEHGLDHQTVLVGPGEGRAVQFALAEQQVAERH